MADFSNITLPENLEPGDAEECQRWIDLLLADLARYEADIDEAVAYAKKAYPKRGGYDVSAFAGRLKVAAEQVEKDLRAIASSTVPIELPCSAEAWLEEQASRFEALGVEFPFRIQDSAPRSWKPNYSLPRGCSPEQLLHIARERMGPYFLPIDDSYLSTVPRWRTKQEISAQKIRSWADPDALYANGWPLAAIAVWCYPYSYDVHGVATFALEQLLDTWHPPSGAGALIPAEVMTPVISAPDDASIAETVNTCPPPLLLSDVDATASTATANAHGSPKRSCRGGCAAFRKNYARDYWAITDSGEGKGDNGRATQEDLAVRYARGERSVQRWLAGCPKGETKAPAHTTLPWPPGRP